MDIEYLIFGVEKDTIYELDAEIGKRIAKGENVEILPEHLSLMQNNGAATGNARKCHNCGYDMTADGFSLDDKRSVVADNDIPDIIQRFRNLDSEKDRKRTDKSFMVPKKEISDND